MGKEQKVNQSKKEKTEQFSTEGKKEREKLPKNTVALGKKDGMLYLNAINRVLQQDDCTIVCSLAQAVLMHKICETYVPGFQITSCEEKQHEIFGPQLWYQIKRTKK